ncbi:MAG TPA: hypothetical protein VK447_04820 [Myxococcaceae bacterium]|nr:hypothetical protein [Myxococcaceae bacterium]
MSGRILKAWTGRLAVAGACAWLAVGCGAVVRGGRLSDRPDTGRGGIFLSTGGSPKPYQTVGFIQVTGEGRTIAGMVDVGDIGLDGVVKGTLAQEAFKMGGEGVINIEFEDENPPTGYERAQEAAQAVQNAFAGEPQEARRRTVVVTGEVIRFIGSRGDQP